MITATPEQEHDKSHHFSNSALHVQRYLNRDAHFSHVVLDHRLIICIFYQHCVTIAFQNRRTRQCKKYSNIKPEHNTMTNILETPGEKSYLVRERWLHQLQYIYSCDAQIVFNKTEGNLPPLYKDIHLLERTLTSTSPLMCNGSFHSPPRLQLSILRWQKTCIRKNTKSIRDEIVQPLKYTKPFPHKHTQYSRSVFLRGQPLSKQNRKRDLPLRPWHLQRNSPEFEHSM